MAEEVKKEEAVFPPVKEEPLFAPKEKVVESPVESPEEKAERAKKALAEKRAQSKKEDEELSTKILNEANEMLAEYDMQLSKIPLGHQYWGKMEEYRALQRKLGKLV
jgi:hypothetical protein